MSVSDLLALLRKPEAPASAPPRTPGAEGWDMPEAGRYFVRMKGIFPAPPVGCQWTGAFSPGATFTDRTSAIAMLDVGYRPLIQGEVIEKGDEHYNQGGGYWQKWVHSVGSTANVSLTGITRTTRPVPGKFLTGRPK